MNVIRTKQMLCTCCMEEHDVKVVCMEEHTIFKNTSVCYPAEYFYCDLAEEFYMDEAMITANDIRMKDAYRSEAGLLTSGEIGAIRVKYGISQSDLCTLLGWGGKTITRYESHQVQDRAHDTILKKLNDDPEWFLCLLSEAEGLLPMASFKKYFETATCLYEDSRDSYLRKSIEAIYVRFKDNGLFNGNIRLSLDKVVDVIRYFSNSSEVNNLYKVKLMKLMWYADFLSYKLRGYAITGLVYQALPMGAVPIGHDSIIDLKGIAYEEIDMGDGTAYRFHEMDDKDYKNLTEEDKNILDIVIDRLGKMNKNRIVEFMHEELAYKRTPLRDIIEFTYADSLQI